MTSPPADPTGYYLRERTDDPTGSYLHEMTPELMKPYYDAVHESEGFDVPPLHNVDVIGNIIPILNCPLPNKVQVCAEEAIKYYNNQHGTNFEVVKIVKANNQAARGILYYITFDVKQVGTPPEFPRTTFQARVLAGLGSIIEVELCRPKPSNN